MGSPNITPAVPAAPAAAGEGRKMSGAFVVILVCVLIITVGSLVLSLWEGDQRRRYEDTQYHALADLEPKGETSKATESKSLASKRETVQKEVESMQKTQDSLMGVFLLGSGAIVGLLTGKLIS